MQSNKLSFAAFAKLIFALFAIWFFLDYWRHQETEFFLNTLNLIFHEAGHTVFFFLGELIQVTAGSALQILVPAVCAGYFFLRKEFYSASIVGLWVATNFLSVGRYAADADVMRLELLGGEAVIHDWNYLLGRFGLLNSAETVGAVFVGIGLIIACAAAVGAVYFAINSHSQKAIDVYN